jgi:tetratricopeptide (TPR) repeat protein
MISYFAVACLVFALVHPAEFGAEASGEYAKRCEDASNQEAVNEKIRVCSEIISTNPQAAWAYNNRGLAWSITGKNTLAIADLTKAIELAPNYADAYYNRGNVWLDHERPDQAIRDYTAAIDLNAQNADAYRNRGLAWERLDQISKSLNYALSAFRLDPRMVAAKHDIDRYQYRLQRKK